MKHLLFLLLILFCSSNVYATFNNISDGDPLFAAPIMQNFRHVNYGSTLLPVDVNGSGVDSAIDIGSSTKYFDDSYIDYGYFSDGISIGTTSETLPLYIYTGDAGATSARSIADEVVIEGAGDAGLSILTPSSSVGSLLFGSPLGNQYGFVKFDHSLNEMSLGTSALSRAVISSGGDLTLSGLDAGNTQYLKVQHSDNTSVSSHSVLELEVGGNLGGDPKIFLDTNSSGTSWTMGVDNNASDRFKIVTGQDLSTNVFFSIDEFGNVGIGDSSPDSRLDIEGSSVAVRIDATGDTEASLLIDSGATSDSEIRFRTDGSTTWSIGADASNADVFTISNSSTLGAGDSVVVNLDGNVGIGDFGPDAKLDVNGNAIIEGTSLTLGDNTHGATVNILVNAEDSSGNEVDLNIQYDPDISLSGGATGAHLILDTVDKLTVKGGAYTSPDDRSGPIIEIVQEDNVGTGEGSILFKGNNGSSYDTKATIRSQVNRLELATPIGTYPWPQIDIDGTNDKIVFYGAGVVVGSPSGASKGEGTINAEAVYDDNTLLTDFVFEKYFLGAPLEERHKNYKMNTFQEEKSFVEKNYHLSTMPGREEWESSGSKSTGELINGLWETVETQFLYIKELEERVAALEGKL